LGVAVADELSVGQLIVSGSGVVAVPHHQMGIAADNVSILDGAVLTHAAATNSREYSLRMSVADTLTVDAASTIDVSVQGYRFGRTIGNTTDGAAEYNSGGSYGGMGASADSSRTTNEVYGDF